MEEDGYPEIPHPQVTDVLIDNPTPLCFCRVEGWNMASHALNQCFVIKPYSSPLVWIFNTCNYCCVENGWYRLRMYHGIFIVMRSDLNWLFKLLFKSVLFQQRCGLKVSLEGYWIFLSQAVEVLYTKALNSSMPTVNCSCFIHRLLERSLRLPLSPSPCCESSRYGLLDLSFPATKKNEKAEW